MFFNKNKRENSEEKYNRYWKFLSRFTAIVMTVVYVVYVTNILFNYLPVDNGLSDFIFNMIYYGPLVICAVTAISAVSHKGPTMRLVVIVIWVFIFLFSFFPNIFYDIIY